MNILQYIFPEYFKNKPTAATFEGWDDWERVAAEKYPVAHFVIDKVLRPIGIEFYIIKRRLKDFKYWFLYRLHPRHQYHKLSTGLKPNYYDPDKRIIEAILTTNVDFIEESSVIIEYQNHHKAFLNAYKWTKTKRPQLQKQVAELDAQAEKIYNDKNFSKMNDFFLWLDKANEAKDYKKIRLKAERIEGNIHDKNKFHCMEILKNIEHMWC